jgi:hypothetical protein
LRKTFYISILIFVLSGIANAQISGQLFQNRSEIPGIEVYFKNSEQKVESDFNGYFKLPMPKGTEKNDLILSGYGITIEIQNVEIDTTKYDLEKFEFPAFKSIKINEYDKLTETEKENCYPIYHWTELVGYFYTKKLEKDYLTFNCNEEITNFEYNSVSKTIKVEWNTIKNCK